MLYLPWAFVLPLSKSTKIHIYSEKKCSLSRNLPKAAYTIKNNKPLFIPCLENTMVYHNWQHFPLPVSTFQAFIKKIQFFSPSPHPFSNPLSVYPFTMRKVCEPLIILDTLFYISCPKRNVRLFEKGHPK